MKRAHPSTLAKLGFLVASVLLAACATSRPTTAPTADAANAVDAGVSDWRAHQPTAGDAPAMTLPNFERASLPNGLTVLVHERRDLPLVTLMVAFGAGSAADPADRPGLADLTYRVMLEGAGSRSALLLAEAFGELGIAPSVLIQPDGALVTAQVLRKNAEAALALFADVAQRPKLGAKDFERRKEERHADLLAREMEPRSAAQNALGPLIFGPTHPYGHPAGGTSATVKQIKLGDARAFYRRWVGPKSVALIVTGDVDLAEVRAWAEKYFGTWAGPAERPAAPAPSEPRARSQIQFIPRPGLDQTVILAGRSAVPAGHPDEAPLDLLLTSFGGSFASRLNLNLREDKAISYGAAALLDERRGTGAWIAGTSVQATATGVGVRELFHELEGLSTRPVTSQELEAARGLLVRSLPSSFETNDSTAIALASLYFHDRPLDEYLREVKALESATPAQLLPLTGRYLGPSTVQLVLAGDPEILRSQIPPLKLGELTPVSPAP
jgi:predicted Zn-dependent peptidase